MNYKETITYLYGLRQQGIKLSLDNPRRLVSLMGHPQKAYRCVHVAGTNGKGSTVSMITSLLKGAGILTGTFTSPHLVSFTERIQVDGKRIGEEDVLALAGRIMKEVERDGTLKPTFFEFATAIAFLYFKNREVQWAVIETGMGGRFDATNVLDPDVTVITPVGLDHREFLGGTIPEIAAEKAGIIKRGVPLVLAPQEEGALGAILEAAGEKAAPVHKYGEDFGADIREMTSKGVRFDYWSRGGGLRFEIRDLFTPLTGAYQAVNGAVAVRAAELVLLSRGVSPDVIADIVRAGLPKTSWPGRCELVSFRGMSVLLDGAHNPGAARALSETLRTVFLEMEGTTGPGRHRGLILIVAAMADKDVREMLTPLLPLAREVVFTSASCGRSEDPRTLLRIASEIRAAGPQHGAGGLNTAGTLEEALELAAGLYTKGDLVVVTGSFYTVGEAREVMGEKAVLAGLREHR